VPAQAWKAASLVEKETNEHRTTKRLNVEHRTSNVQHRTSNIERPILMALRFSYIKQANHAVDVI
jgi:hypothetical protein